MNQDATAGESHYQLKCKESALAKSNAVHRLAPAIADGSRGVSLASLVPVLKAINGITLGDDEQVIRASDELASIVDQKKKDLVVEDLEAIGEVNFFESCHSFVSYFKARKMGHEEEKVDANAHPFNSSIHNTSIGPTGSAKRMASTRIDLTMETPAKKSALRAKRDPSIEDEEEEEIEAKSSRPSVDNGSKISCVFNGCTAKFKTTKDLAAHAEECERKLDLDLVFRCSGCAMTRPSHKAVESHIVLNPVICPNATVTVTAQERQRARRLTKTPRKYENDFSIEREDNSKSQERLRERRETKTPRKYENDFSLEREDNSKSQERRRERREQKTPLKRVKDVVPSIGGEDDSESQELECKFKDCQYSSMNFCSVYQHVKLTHPDQKMTFECLGCGETRHSGRPIQLHAQKCGNAKVELTLTKKQDTAESEMLVTKQKYTKNTAGGSSVGKPVSPVIVKRKRGRPSLKSMKKDDEVSDIDASQILAQDDIEVGEEEVIEMMSESGMDYANKSDDEDTKYEVENVEEMNEDEEIDVE